MVISFRFALTDMPRVMVDHISGHPMTQSSSHNQLTMITTLLFPQMTCSIAPVS